MNKIESNIIPQPLEQQFGKLKPDIPTMIRDSRGRILWKLPGNTPEENEQLRISNVQGLFLEKFPEFIELFPFRKDGKIIEEKRDEARGFILKKIGSQKKFTNSIGGSAIIAFSSHRAALKNFFQQLGIEFSNVFPSEGWMTKNELASHLGRSATVIQKLASKYKDSHPEWSRNFLYRSDRWCEHYSPELVTSLLHEYSEFIQPEEGWETAGALARQVKVSHEQITKFANGQKDFHPEWFKYFRGPNGIHEYYSPKVVALFMQEHSIHTNGPQGWLTNNAIRKLLRIGGQSVKGFVGKYRQTNPEYFQTYLDKGGKPSEHYSPDLVAVITNEYYSITKAPEGWMTGKALARLLKVSYWQISNLSQRFKESNPEFFQSYRDSRGYVLEHYSPDLVAVITNEYYSITKAPEGWMTTRVLAKKLKVSDKYVIGLVNKYRKLHPAWFDTFRDRSGVSRIHYSPELAEEITRLKMRSEEEAETVSQDEANKELRNLLS